MSHYTPNPQFQPQGQPSAGGPQFQPSAAQPQYQQSAPPPQQFQQPGYGMAEQQPTAPILVTIGDIQVTGEQVITPRGAIPLRQAQFTFQDLSIHTSKIPGWAIALAVIGFFFALLGLLFLLVKEESTTGFVQVSVVGPGFTHTTQLPVSSPQQVSDIAARVQHANNIATSQRY